MRTFLQASLVWSGILLSFAGYGQVIPLGALPMQYNPAFAGEAGGPRFNLNAGLLTASRFRHNDYNLNTSYDHFIPAIRSGIGFSAGYYTSSVPYIATEGYRFTVAVAPKFSLKGKYTISPSLDLTYGSSALSSNPPPGTLEPLNLNGYHLLGRAAVLVNSRKWYAGYSVDIPLHNTYRYRLFGRNDISPERFTSYWQFGYTFQRSSESKFSFTPQIVFLTGTDRYNRYSRNSFRYFAPEAFSLNFRYGKFIWGANNAGFHVGVQTERVRVMLSNGFGRRGLVTSDGLGDDAYTGNISFRYMLKQSRW
jgi:hypothetical protein